MNAERNTKTSFNLFSNRKSTRKRESGFTFAEVLVTLLFAAIVIPVALHGIALANRAETIADRKVDAAYLADKVLNELLVTEEWKYGNKNGDFGYEWPYYRWELTTEQWHVDSMQLVTVSVYFEVQEQLHSVHISTLADDTEDNEE